MRSPLGLPLGRLFLLLAAMAMLAASNNNSIAETVGIAEHHPLIDGTFIQLQEKHGHWSRAKWEELFNEFQAIGLQRVVIQWVVNDKLAFYPTQTFDQVTHPPLETILQIADKNGIDVYIGLAVDSQYWEKIKQPHLYMEDYLNRLRLKSARVAQEVAGTAIKYRAFKGWYISEEIDDVTWRPPKARNLLYQHIKQLTLFLKKLTPNRMVMLSGFSNASMDPDSYNDFWQRLFREAPVDILLFQDGVGAGKLSFEELPLYLQAVRNATDANGRMLQVVVELFRTSSISPFKAMPADMQRIKRQLEIAAAYATYGIGSFSVPDYMTPEGGDAADELLQSYKRYGKFKPVK